MSRLLLAASLTAAAAAGLAAFPAAADRNNHNTLDDRGKPFGVAWSETGRFETLTATGIDDVRLVSGDRWRIRATGDARAIAQLRFLVERDSLIVGRVSEPRERFGKAQVEITAPSLRAVTAAGSGVVDIDRIAGARASATVAGSGRTTVRLVEAERLSATVAGSGGLALAGRSERADITVAGSGGLTGDGFTAGSASVTVAGSGAARFRSPGRVSATIVGSGSVNVAGTSYCSQTRMGSGRLVCTR
jgi:hypothetical protein